MNIHFIAIGGSAMHNLAIALKQKGYTITGSDDEIFEPSRSRLEREGLLPDREGWFPQKITSSLDAVVLGMHARADNPELIQAQQLGLKIYSYPEYLYEQTKDKTRVVIGGSHGKTTITSMVMHVLKSVGVDFDFMVGAQIDGFDNMVRLSEGARFAIFEGDEYLTSPIDPRPKFHLYKPHIAVISGIAWDHINVFPDFDTYRRQFEMFIQTIEPHGHLVFCAEDPEVECICKNVGSRVNTIPYTTHPHTVNFDRTALITDQAKLRLKYLAHTICRILPQRRVFVTCWALAMKIFTIPSHRFGGPPSACKGLAERILPMYSSILPMLHPRFWQRLRLSKTSTPIESWWLASNCIPLAASIPNF